MLQNSGPFQYYMTIHQIEYVNLAWKTRQWLHTVHDHTLALLKPSSSIVAIYTSRLLGLRVISLLPSIQTRYAIRFVVVETLVSIAQAFLTATVKCLFLLSVFPASWNMSQILDIDKNAAQYPTLHVGFAESSSGGLSNRDTYRIVEFLCLERTFGCR